MTQDSGGVRATLRQSDGAVTNCTAAYLAGCGGARLRVREMLRIEFPGGTYDEFCFLLGDSGHVHSLLET